MSFNVRSNESPMEFEYQSPNPNTEDVFTPSKKNDTKDPFICFRTVAPQTGGLFSTPVKQPLSNMNFAFNSPEPVTPNKSEPADLDKPSLQEHDTPPPTEKDGQSRSVQLSKRSVRKRKAGENNHWRAKSTSDLSESEEELVTSNSLLDSVTYNADMPYIISGWLQLFFNLFLIAVILYIILQFIYTVQRDIDIKVEEYSMAILEEIGKCSKDYITNQCSPVELRLPGLKDLCNTWEACMKRDPTVIGRAKVSAETFAEILNNFVEPISYKTMIFFTLLIFGSLFLSNFAFGFLRSRTRSDYQYYLQNEAYHQPARTWTTPRRTSSRYIKSR
ncbi:hypothetical protein K493DRAFT_265657 [Basidiobolus meristosporus CBS 931.73]|uniref:Brl1/Brr6 domain-containing protein n=1 Tax=Basidiobolus meristosporus CBS 931.73 TaxID=1314790 RepID=A0A1Y1XXQ0_9FUNG|nr:hypothetical protein K493DRAFT_265657 [Basidiobolus meristosporus CBS 931.73]|eukprot:ORX90521.1 hypothetical protein K493DRAFT_265657 [Basidiobolus meristosporus CBS 931.73]